MRQQEALLERWNTQLRKGALELLILAAIVDRPRYGFELIAVLRDRAGFELPEGTIYPLLLRLTKDGLVETEWRQGEAAPRKYYRPTALGRRMLAAMAGGWRNLAKAVDIMTGEAE